jgi:hypothetical protein
LKPLEQYYVNNRNTKERKIKMISLNPFDIIEMTIKVFLALSPIVVAAIIYNKYV